MVPDFHRAYVYEACINYVNINNNSNSTNRFTCYYYRSLNIILITADFFLSVLRVWPPQNLWSALMA